MNPLTVLLLAVSLAMDAFAVSICKGLSIEKFSAKVMVACAIWFGLFQGMMPAIGYFAGKLVVGAVEQFSAWIAFILLALIGVNMIRESGEDEKVSPSISFGEMFMLAVATSIDALAVGVSFSMTPVVIMAAWNETANAMLACVIIALVTGLISALGVRLGAFAGHRFRRKAKFAGGLILILIGVRILFAQYGMF